MTLPFYAKLLIVILLTLAIAEIVPDFVNVLLVLILVGMVLSQWPKFAGLTQILKF